MPHKMQCTGLVNYSMNFSGENIQKRWLHRALNTKWIYQKSTEYYHFDWDSNPVTDQGRLDFNHSVKLILQDMLNLQDLFHMSLMFFIRKILQCQRAWSGLEIISLDQIGQYVLAAHSDLFGDLTWEEDRGYYGGKSLLLLMVTTKTRKTSLAYNSIGLTFYTLSLAWSISTQPDIHL